MKLLLIPLLLTVAAQGGADAEKRFKAMEAKIAKADTLQITFDGKIETAKGGGPVKGTLTIGAGGKGRLTAEADVAGKTAKLEMVSDGNKVATRETGLNWKNKDVPRDFRAKLNAIAGRTGIVAGVFLLTTGQENLQDALKASDFKLLPAEKVGGRYAAVVQYQLTVKDKKAIGTLWLDAKTNLPLKRVLRPAEGNDGATFTEIYSAFTLNPKLDAKLFELPK